MRLYMIRHGQSETNLRGEFTGCEDVALTDRGREDARHAGERLCGIAFDRVYSSDLSRAVETAKIALPGCEPILRREIREVDVGSLALRSFQECYAQYGEELVRTNLRENRFSDYGGEDYAEFCARVRRFLDEVASQEDGCFAAFAHAGVLKAALAIVMGLDRPPAARCPNGAIAVFAFENGRWELERWG